MVKVNHLFYNTIEDQCGTNQGGPLSPNLLRFMLVDLSEYLDGNFGVVMDKSILVHLLCADDLV